MTGFSSVTASRHSTSEDIFDIQSHDGAQLNVISVAQGYKGQYSMYDHIDVEDSDSEDAGFDTNDEPEDMSDSECSSAEE